MTQEATQLEVPNFEATTDGKKIFTPKQWLERFRQYTKRKYKTDIAELIRGEEITQTDWATNENQVQDDFVWGIGPEALYQMTEQNTRPSRTKSQSKNKFGYSTSTSYRKEIHITTGENAFGPNKLKPKHRRTFGGD